MTILGLVRVLFCENEQTYTKWYVKLKILTWMLMEARGGLEAAVGNGVTTRLYPNNFLFLSFCFNHILDFRNRLRSKSCQHISDIVGLSQADV